MVPFLYNKSLNREGCFNLWKLCKCTTDEYASIITDSTYRGGKYDEITKQENGNPPIYYDDDESGEVSCPFTVQSITPDEGDDVSVLQSVRGVEDCGKIIAWFDII